MATEPKQLTVRDKKAQLLQGPKFNAALQQVLPEHLNPERYVRMYLDACMSTPKLFECTDGSVIRTVLKAAELGLEIGSALGHCYAIPFGNKCELVIGYKGFAELAYRSGRVKTVAADVVSKHEWDARTFTIRKSPPEVFHELDPEIGVIAEPDLFLAYARIELLTGGVVLKVLNREQVHARRPSHWDRKKDSPWITHPDAMWRKTALRALLSSGEVPLSPELTHAMGYADPAMVMPAQKPFDPVDADAVLADLGVSDE